MSEQIQALLPQILAALPQIPGIDMVMTMIMVKITAAVIVLTTLVTGGILSRMIRSAITDSLYPNTYRNSLKNRENLMMSLIKDEIHFPTIQCNQHKDFSSDSPQTWTSEDKEDTESTIAIKS